MATFVLIHGGGDSSYYWHLVEPELRARGHDVVAPDLPRGETSMSAYAESVIEAIGDRTHLVVVGQSFGGFTATRVAASVDVELLVFVAGMVPVTGESPDDWWTDTGYAEAVRVQAAKDGGLTGNEDPYVCFCHDVPRQIAEEAERRGGMGTLSDMDEPFGEWPDVPTRFVLCTEDRFFPADYLRGVAENRLGIACDEIAASHCVALSRPGELADLLDGYLRSTR